MKEDDHGNIRGETSHYAVGERVIVTTESGKHEYQVAAKCRMNYSNDVRYQTISNGREDSSFYLPAYEFKAIVPGAAAYYGVNRQSIVERLRVAE